MKTGLVIYNATSTVHTTHLKILKTYPNSLAKPFLYFLLKQLGSLKNLTHLFWGGISQWKPAKPGSEEFLMEESLKKQLPGLIINQKHCCHHWTIATPKPSNWPAPSE